MGDLVERLRSSAKAFREHPIHTEDGDSVLLIVQADELDEAASSLEQLLSVRSLGGEWRAIETAPKDGSKIVALLRSGEEVPVYSNAEWEPEALRLYTHWRPQVDCCPQSPGLLADDRGLPTCGAAQGNASAQLPDGFVLVPREPTDEMIEMADDAVRERAGFGLGPHVNEIWNAMVSAAPPSPAGGGMGSSCTEIAAGGPSDDAAGQNALPPGPVNCTHVLRREGKAYPRTCERCRLGPCPFYNNDGSLKP